MDGFPNDVVTLSVSVAFWSVVVVGSLTGAVVVLNTVVNVLCDDETGVEVEVEEDVVWVVVL